MSTKKRIQTRQFVAAIILITVSVMVAKPIARALRPAASANATLQLPDGTVMLKVDIKGDVEDSSGVAWTSPVAVRVDSKDGAVATVDVTPGALGEITCSVYIPLAVALAYPSDVGVWGDPASLEARGPVGPFVTAQEGLAAFYTGTPTGTPPTGGLLNIGTVVMAEPPKVAKITLQSATTDPMTFHAAEGDRSQVGLASGEWYTWSHDLAVGTSQVDLYSWGTHGNWHYEFRSGNGSPQAFGFARRNSTVVTGLTDEVLFSVDVDMALFPDAKRVMFVDPANHQPNASAPGGSDLSYHQVYAESSSSPLESDGTLLGGNQLNITASESYAQVWGWDDDPASVPVFQLLTWKHLPVATGAQAVSIP